MKFNPMLLPGMRYKHHVQDSKTEYYSIGDVHGCAREYKKLLDSIDMDARSRGREPFIIQHGDIIDRGPEFREVFDHSSECGTVNLLGNHEHNFFLERVGKPCNSNSRQVSHDRFSALSKALQDHIMRTINSMYNFAVIEIGKRTFVLTHAPLKNMEKYQDWQSLIHIGNAPYFCMRSSVPIDEDMEKMDLDVTFVYGHQSWEYKEIEEQKNEQSGRRTQYYNIDSSCVYGGQLIALRLSDLGVLRVDSNVKVAK